MDRISFKRNSGTSISEMPLEVLAEMLSYLDKGSKLSARVVSKNWKEILDTFFFRFNGVITDESLASIRDSALTFHTITVKDLLKTIPPGPGTSLSRSNLALNPTNLVFKQKDAGKRQFDEESVSGENMAMILLYNKNAKSLKFGKNSLQAIRSLRVEGLLMKHLETLEIKLMEEISDRENSVLLQIAKIKKPLLSTLILESTKIALVSNERDNFIHYVSLFNFIAAHKCTLKSLEFRNFYPMTLQMELSPLSSPSLIQILLRKIKEDLDDIQLHTLKVLFPRQEGTFPYNLGFHLLSTQNRLTNLEVNVPFCGDLSLLYRQVCLAVERNRRTLTQFSIHRYIVKPNVDEIRSVLATLSKCENLQDLQLYLYTIPTFFCKLPSTIRRVTLLGNLEPGILLEVKASLPLLEHFHFSNLAAVNGEKKVELRNNLKAILRMVNIRKVKWYTEGFDMDFLASEPGLRIRRINNNLFIFVITIVR